jgi:hypothetical protein
MAREKRHFAPLKRSQNVRIRRISKRSLLHDLVGVAEARHVVQTAAADNANLCLLQMRSWLRLEMNDDCGTRDYTRRELMA